VDIVRCRRLRQLRHCFEAPFILVGSSRSRGVKVKLECTDVCSEKRRCDCSWTDRAHSLNLDHFSFNSKVGCNYHPSSAWASVQAVTADASIAMLTDRSRGVASLTDGSLEYILHRHATGGNGRGPSDGDPNAARGTVTLVPSASTVGFKVAVGDTPKLALMRAHPVAVMYGSAIVNIDAEWSSALSAFSPLTRSLPDEVHLFSWSRRAFQKLVS
jgi:hypothetical protein